MAGTGVVYKDLLPIPEATHAVVDPDKEEKTHALGEEATASHALATAEHDEKGAAQKDHHEEVKDLGWNATEHEIAAPLVGGLPNEDLWLLVRRFNKQMYHVKESTEPAPGNLDLNIADEDEFSPDKLRSAIERLYTTIIIGLIGMGKHIVRLRSWRETRRTACFTTAYFVAWMFDFLVPLFATTLIVLIMYEPSRGILFPPAPIALVDSNTGGVQKPKAGVLGSHDSATGAPENYKGEAVEQEATHFVNGIASVALSSATGKHPMNEPEPEDNAPHDAVPDPSALASSAAAARTQVSGEATGTGQDKAKVPMETAIWSQMRPIMHAIGDATDGWERFANALSPTPPFPQEGPRLRLAGLIVPLLAVSVMTSSYLFVKGVTFGIGTGFFGDPVITRGIDLLNRKIPNWQKLLEIRNTILKGVPTNAQLTITLLRVGEANKAPLPPPPSTNDHPPDEPAAIESGDLGSTGADTALGASDAEIQAAIAHDPATAHETAGADIDAGKDAAHGKKGSKILGLFKGSVKASVATAMGADKVKATAGSSHAKNRLGVVPPRNAVLTSGPVDFKARFRGKKGHLYISAKATIPCVSFSTDSTIEKIGSQDREDLHPLWSVAVADIKELKKVGGFGWKAKLVVGWALERTVADGLEITDRLGVSHKVTAVPLRDELFNRLIAMAGQKWVSW